MMQMKENGKGEIGTDIHTRFESFVSAVMRAYRCVQKLKSAQSKAMGLRSNHIMCLYFLGKHTEGVTAAELCKLCHEDKAAISRTIFDMTQKGLVLPAEEPSKKKYRTTIKLTESGEAQSERLQRIIEHVVRTVSDDFSPKERDTFYRVFFSIVDHLDEICLTDEIAG